MTLATIIERVFFDWRFMDIAFIVLTILIGLVFLFLFLLLSFQVIFILFAPLKPKKFKKHEAKNRFAIIIPAHNEESVISNSVNNLLNNIDYPRDLYDVYVCADNCSDSTYKLAKEAGAIVYERFCEDPNKKRAAYPIKLLIEKVLEADKYDAVIKFDADNLPCPEFLLRMNDAISEGVNIARAHEAPSNMGQNIWSSVSSCYYARDSRLACNFRERMDWNSMISGAGMMVTTKVLKEIGGWDALSGIDDAEFAVKRMLGKYHINYISEAIVYEDQPSSRKDSANRNARMANALNKLYFGEGMKLLGMFFKTGKLTYLDMWCQLSFVPLPLALSISIPIYLAFYFITLGLEAGGIHIYSWMFTPGLEGTAFLTIKWTLIAGLIALGLFYILWTYQSWLGVYLDRKILGKNWYKDARKGIWLGAFAMIVYGFSVTDGTSKKKVKWASIKRNPQNNDKK